MSTAASAQGRDLLRARHGGHHHRVEFVELFFDLVFVFAVTQVSHALMAHFTWRGALEAALLDAGDVVGVDLHGVGHQLARSREDCRCGSPCWC